MSETTDDKPFVDERAIPELCVAAARAESVVCWLATCARKTTLTADSFTADDVAKLKRLFDAIAYAFE